MSLRGETDSPRAQDSTKHLGDGKGWAPEAALECRLRDRRPPKTRLDCKVTVLPPAGWGHRGSQLREGGDRSSPWRRGLRNYRREGNKPGPTAATSTKHSHRPTRRQALPLRAPASLPSAREKARLTSNNHRNVNVYIYEMPKGTRTHSAINHQNQTQM